MFPAVYHPVLQICFVGNICAGRRDVYKVVVSAIYPDKLPSPAGDVAQQGELSFYLENRQNIERSDFYITDITNELIF